MVCQTAPRVYLSVCCALAFTLLIAGCGELHFVPSPFTPQEVELVYSEQEHLTVMRWRVDADAPVAETRFEMLGSDGGYHPIDFSTSVFRGGVVACGDGAGACAQYVVRGKYQVDRTARPVRAVHDVYGVLPGSSATTRTVSETLKIQSFFHWGNDLVYVNITDDVARAGPYSFPRPYERTMWPTVGLCVADTAPDGVSFSTLDQTSGFAAPTPLTDAGTYCVATRAIPTDGGDAAVAEAKIATLPEVVTASKTFEAPIERSPIIYQIVFDLEIPVPDRCTDVIQKVEDLTARYLQSGGVAVHKLPTINLADDGSSPCAQNSVRTVPATQMANAFKELARTLPGTHHQYHMLYFNNLNAPLASPLVTSLQSLSDAMSISPVGYQLDLFSWLFNPGVATASPVKWWAYWVWQTVDETFQIALADYQSHSLPYTTQFHDPNEPVPLLSLEETTAYDGKLIKICSSSSSGTGSNVQPVRTVPFIYPINTPSWLISSADPPSYLVTLNNQIVVRGLDFVEASAIVNYQICTRYCTNHGFLNSSGGGEKSWEDTFSCASSGP
jgi:hypothetical protein